jgi:hypothetical protein
MSEAEDYKISQQHKQLEYQVNRRLCNSDSDDQKPNHTNKNLGGVLFGCQDYIGGN